MSLSRVQFNTQQYSWSDTEILVNGTVLTGVQGVMYGSTQDKELIYGKGAYPLTIGRGNKSFKGELTVLQSELERIISGAPSGDILDYRNLSVVVSYASEGGSLVTDALIGVEFVDVEKAIRQADTKMVVNLPIIFLNVNYNI
ncbi:hypothetical protein [Spirosoma aerolatum]|uniref:hypothetical protein n=1 Tax=Spirosoma aerolatum TaxID=1211326 RepID=UPI0009AD409F|nr:hypothetical protein [Spirosoma aerolatum]